VIGAVVPVCNRRENLELLIASLEEQTVDDFALVVADDGSTDGTRDYVEELAGTPRWNGRLSWVGCGPDRGVRTGRARNIGAANLPSGVSLLLMLDSDLVLQPTAIDGFAQAHQAHPSAVLFGLVDWLPPLNRDDITTHVRQREPDRLRAQVPTGPPRRVSGTFTGPELRPDLYDHSPDKPTPLRPEWALPLNSAWPLSEYWRVGGFDEAMQGYGYQDMEFGARAAQAGIQCVPCPELWALHVWHPKGPKAMVENQRNLDHYLRKHGAYLRSRGNAEHLEVDADWRLWWHYHAERGGTVVRAGTQLWALNTNRQHRLALPDLEWMPKLGHCRHDVPVVTDTELSSATDHGVASDTTT
jgi:glycosyltransferase involved in cell wall biosynthesis